MEHLKRSHEAVAGDVLVGLSGFAPAMLLALGLRTATHVPQRSVNTVTTNVPGPQRPLYAAGRRMLECFPYVPLGGHVRVGVAIFSYDGALGFGVTGDYDRAPDIGVLCSGHRALDGRRWSRPRARPSRRRQPSPTPPHAHGGSQLMALDDRLDLYAVKTQFERFTDGSTSARSPPTSASCGARGARCSRCR